MKTVSGRPDPQTAFTLADVLNQADEQRAAFKLFNFWPEISMEGPLLDKDGREYWQGDEHDGSQPHLDAMLDLIALIYRVAESRITGISLDSDDDGAISQLVNEHPFFAALNSNPRYRGGVSFSTRAALDGDLAKRLTQARAKTKRANGGKHCAIPEVLFAEMASEGMAWHATHPADEVRCCACCGKWFVALYRKRARFCSDGCRKGLVQMAEQHWPQFHCVIGNHDVATSLYSGLKRSERADRLSMAGFIQSHLDEATCAACVERDYHLWRDYVLPVLNNRVRVAT